MKQAQETTRLASGLQLPLLGYGVYRIKPEATAEAVKTALDVGYRMIDTAAAYFNEEQVGRAVLESGIPRDEIVIQTKAWVSDYSKQGIRHALERSKRKLGTTVDVFLMHQPGVRDPAAMIEAWREMEQMVADKEVGAIGVCNFGPNHLDVLLGGARMAPQINQVELHPFFTQQAIREHDARHNVLTQAWSPIGGVMRYWGDDKAPSDDPLTHPLILQLAAKYGRTPAQVILRWQIEIGNSVIPRSSNPDRIAENFAIFDFQLSAEDRAAIDALDRGERGGPDPDNLPDELYERKIPD
ncbi:aldo/keto reductase [Rhizobium sp. 2MFCol3.1]|uniref:aldo/keto reductase n=1 Tax=Rhizobium sp. 2MFCol3.1 TaxID=1246459 RepID=UPI0003766CE0|nr:aldo/keto reductase [Rhizobium sp. 2MFCol3.1]